MLMFEQVTIVGVGLLGASLGMALRKRALAGRVIGVGRAGSDSLKIAQERGAIDEGVADIAAGVKGSSLVVLCTPVCTFPAIMDAMGKRLGLGTIVTDVGSTKAQVMAWAKEKLARTGAAGAFVGSHPMAGSEKTGPGAARENLYEGAMCLMVEGKGNPEGGAQHVKDKVEAMWRTVGMKTVWMGAEEHDRVVGVISHLPHVAAFALAATVGRSPESFVAAGGGYGDTTRIAGSDVTMWRDIFLTNGPAVVEAIGALEMELAGLKAAIAAGNGREIERRLTAAREAREAVLAKANTGRETRATKREAR